jgi:GntR family transcriptional regulator, rspAB operon transcriptional repressor
MARQSTNGRRLLKDKAYTRVRDMILKGEIMPGTILSKRQLARQLRMSKTPVDSALERLESEGFVHIAPRQGVVVREASIRDAADLFGIRLALEPYVVRQLAGRLSRSQAERLTANVDAQAAAMLDADHDLSAHLDTSYHMMLCEFLGNTEILRVMQQLRNKVDRIVLQVFNTQPQRLTTNHQEHAAIASAVIDGKGDEAADRMEAHLETGQRYLVVSSPAIDSSAAG